MSCCNSVLCDGNCDCNTKETIAVPGPTIKELRSCIQNVEDHEKELGAIIVFLNEKFPDDLSIGGYVGSVLQWYNLREREKEKKFKLESDIRKLEALGYSVFPPGTFKEVEIKRDGRND